jgi:hypothetical protein
MPGFFQEVDPPVRPNHYGTISRAREGLPSRNSLGLLRLDFQLLYKIIKCEYLIIFDQIEL